MSETELSRETVLDLEDIQAGLLQPRPSPYVGTYLLFRIDDRRAGRELLRRVIPAIGSVATVATAPARGSVSVAVTFQGLQALGVPRESLDSFAPEFRQGMAARAELLHDVGASAPQQWEAPFGSGDVHLGIMAISTDRERLDDLLDRALAEKVEPGVALIYRHDCYMLESKREAFGFKDGLSQPGLEGSPIPGTNPQERPLRAGEFILGYPDELDELPSAPVPDVLGRNGTYVAVRKVYQDVAAFRCYLRDNASAAVGEDLLAAKMMGRWPSGAPLARAPRQDDPRLGADPDRNDDFLYAADGDERGFTTPPGSHIRRMHPRDDLDFGDVRRHRLLRRGTSYGPPLPEGVLEDDGADRGIFFVFLNASLTRQFEFVQREWINTGIFIGAGTERDPIAGANDGSGEFVIPDRPIRRRVQGLPAFAVTRGGEYFFMPGLRALRWLADMQT